MNHSNEFLLAKKCPVCGKEFYPAPMHAYKMKRYGRHVPICTYKCFIAVEKKKK